MHQGTVVGNLFHRLRHSICGPKKRLNEALLARSSKKRKKAAPMLCRQGNIPLYHVRKVCGEKFTLTR